MDLRECHVLHPTLFALLRAVADVAADAALHSAATAGAIVNLLDSRPGPATAPRWARSRLGRPDAPRRFRLCAWHRAYCLCHRPGRSRRSPASSAPSLVTFAGVPVAPPPGAFLQASCEGEQAITDAVLAGLPDKLARRAWIAELFAGCGTLTFPLARRARVVAYEGDEAAILALRSAANAAGLAGRVTATIATWPAVRCSRRISPAVRPWCSTRPMPAHCRK